MTEINLTPEAKQAAIENMMAENRRKIRDIQKTGVTITPESMESSKDRMFLNWMMNNLLDENQRMDFEISWQNFLLRELEKMKEKASDTVAEADEPSSFEVPQPPTLRPFNETHGGRVSSDSPRGHGQRANDRLMECPQCRSGDCTMCPDKIFLVLGKDTVCTCKKSGHQDAINGEPRQNQIRDPFTGDVHAPGLVVKADTGEVEFNRER